MHEVRKLHPVDDGSDYDDDDDETTIGIEAPKKHTKKRKHVTQGK